MKKIFFYNCSSQILFLKINGMYKEISPYGTNMVIFDDIAPMLISVAPKEESSVVKRRYGVKQYFLFVETQYDISGLDDETTIKIGVEKIESGHSVIYNRCVFLSPEYFFIGKHYTINNEEKIKKFYNKRKMKEDFFFVPFVVNSKSNSFFLFLALVLWISLGWKVGLSFLCIVYPLFYLWQIIINERTTSYDRFFNQKCSKEYFYEKFTDDYIKALILNRNLKF